MSLNSSAAFSGELIPGAPNVAGVGVGSVRSGRVATLPAGVVDTAGGVVAVAPATAAAAGSDGNTTDAGNSTAGVAAGLASGGAWVTSTGAAGARPAGAVTVADVLDTGATACAPGTVTAARVSPASEQPIPSRTNHVNEFGRGMP